MKQTAWLVSLALLVAGTGCQPPPPQRQSLVVSGSPTLAPLLEELAARFMEEYPQVRVDVQPTSSDRAVEDTRTGLADLGMIARPLKPGEAGLRVFPLARDGVAVVVHKNNPVPGLDKSQFVGVFTHTVTSWKEVGGTDAPVLAISHAEGRPLRATFLDFLGLTTRQVTPGPVVGTSTQALTAVAHQPQALSYASLGEAWQAVEGGLPVRLLSLGSVSATPENVANGSYPLTYPLNLLTRGQPQAVAVRDFVDFTRSATIHDLVRKHAFAPASP